MGKLEQTPTYKETGHCDGRGKRGSAAAIRPFQNFFWGKT